MPVVAYAVRYPDRHGEGGAAFLASAGGGAVRRDAFLETAWLFERVQAEVLATLYPDQGTPKFGPAEVVYVSVVQPSGRREVHQVRPLGKGERDMIARLVADALAKEARKAHPAPDSGPATKPAGLTDRPKSSG